MPYIAALPAVALAIGVATGLLAPSPIARGSWLLSASLAGAVIALVSRRTLFLAAVVAAGFFVGGWLLASAACDFQCSCIAPRAISIRACPITSAAWRGAARRWSDRSRAARSSR